MPLTQLERRNNSQNLQRRLGTRAERYFLELQAMTVHSFEDDFVGDTLDGLYQSTASGANSVAAAISTGVVNGAILLDAGDANSGRSDLSYGRHYRGDQGAIYVARFSINTITNRKFEIGFTDVISGTDAGAVNVRATPSFNADDCAVLCFDTSDNSSLKLVGNKATTAATSVSFSLTLASATYYYFQVALFNDVAVGTVFNADGGFLEEQRITSAVTATVLLTPWLFVQNRTASAGSMTADYHRAYQRRTSV